MASAGLLSLEQSSFFVLGASIGSGVATYFIGFRVSGKPRQLALLQALFKILGVGLLLPLFLAESHFGSKFLMNATRELAADPAHQVAIIYLANAYLETATEDAARLVLTNQAGSMTASQFQTALCNNITTLFTCSNIMINLAPATSETSISTAAPTFNSDGTLANPVTYTQPNSGQIAVLQVFYQWPVIGLPFGWNFANLGNGTYLMMSTQVFIVEPQ